MLEYNLQFFAKDGPGGEKTEEPTQKKLTDARKEGQVAKSREVVNAAMLLGLFLLMKFWIGNMGNSFISFFQNIYSQIPEYVKMYDGYMQEITWRAIFIRALIRILTIVAPVFLIGFLLAFIVNLLQVKWKPTTKPMKPKFNKLNPASGIKRLFSPNSLVELLKSIAKIAIVVYAVYSYLIKNAPSIYLLYDLTLNQAIAQVGDLVVNLGFRISFFYILIAAADYIYQKFKFKKDMKMTKQEVKDEYKNQEGDPKVKSKQRQRMMEASRRRMMQQLPEADVVITNPTHYAVAIKYDPEIYDAPYVIA
ncbi:MAG: EscU/YscU/HrcU family type III secretion system export apparatus switch protein, partial [Lachnospiraceae bacterium]|nr:EscU/YscU/HrcU family type III secretion system export apparatus switch protein [Lachnospiraceae bacterium]